MSDKSLDELSIEELFAKLSIKPGSSLSKIALQLKEYEVDGAVLADSADNLDELFEELEMNPKPGPKLALKKFLKEHAGTKCTATQEDADSLSSNTVDIPITNNENDTPTPTEPSVPVILEGPRIMEKLQRPVPLQTYSSRNGVSVKAVATNHRDPSQMKVLLIVDPTVVPIEELDISAFGETTVTISGGPLRQPVLHTFELKPPDSYLPRKTYHFTDATNNQPIQKNGKITFSNRACRNSIIEFPTNSHFNMESVVFKVPNGIYDVTCAFPGYTPYTFPNIHFNMMWSSSQETTLFLTSKTRAATGADLITLRWNLHPRDLDLHAFSSKEDHVFYSHKVSKNFALDIDVTKGHGPETLTVQPVEYSLGLQEHCYMVFVHLYAGEGKLYSSGATLQYNLPSTSKSGNLTIPRDPVAGNPRIWLGFMVMGKQLQIVNQVLDITVEQAKANFLSSLKQKSRKLIQQKKCTLPVAGKAMYRQEWFKCNTCSLNRNLGCCATCARICHKGHNVETRGEKMGFCDCGETNTVCLVKGTL